ncbi:RNA polymerase sigma factor [Oceanobacillus senegalensis]|uniref:RNA polymerase sigma factor n=1 Tax=Oceanobacillus senegalensis TaxID=1936063 RepID=UPI001FE5FBA3|nr:sigma-70 family RNA polymerase sigma factor [Oceanobacillus senegalensis]
MKLNADLQEMLQEKSEIIFKYLVKIGAAPSDAEDIIQEALYKFILYMDSIDSNKAYSWLFRVSLNRYYDLCRKQKRNVRVSMENVELVDESLLPEEFIQQDERNKEIQDLLNQLTPLHKQLLLLKYDLELSYQEIAEMLDLNIGTLKTYLYRARESFKQKYRREQTKNDGSQR